MTRDFDVVVVGARCAGAPLATFLARSGVRVLVVDRAPLPSEHVLSTHLIHPPGFDVLAELGVADKVLSSVRPARSLRLVRDGTTLDLSFPQGRIECCPRRARLDGLLQEAAVEAGAELRDRTRVTEVLFDDERAVGVRIESDGCVTEVRSELVVGADGRRSTVADQVGTEEYLAYDAPRACFWSYWPMPAEWLSDRHPYDMYLARRESGFRSVFQTDDDHLLISSMPPVERIDAWRHRPLEALREDLENDPVAGPLARSGEPVEKVRGTVRERYFFRRATGPGWALVGDAGHHKDFVIGDGISEALLQARSLAKAILEGTDEALRRWWRERDVEALPLFFWAQDEGATEPAGPLLRSVFRAIAADPELSSGMVDLLEHRMSPYDLAPPGPAFRALLGCLLRGRFRAVGEFVAQGQRASAFERELRSRKRLAAEAR